MLLRAAAPGRSWLARAQLSAFRKHQFVANSQVIVGRCLLAAKRRARRLAALASSQIDKLL
jgi:hypothetical protein